MNFYKKLGEIRPNQLITTYGPGSIMDQQILAIMEAGIEYSTEQVAEKIGLKGPRTRQLLNELVNKELLACIGTTKRRRYIKPVD